MQERLIQILRKRRDDIHRRIDELRSDLAVFEARAEELEEVLKEALKAERATVALTAGTTFTSPPKIATDHSDPTVADVILKAMEELEDSGFDAAERNAIFKIVRRSMPKAKGNTLRVALQRLVKQSRVVKIGNLYRHQAERR
jgi:hypothetical protein